MPPIYDIYLMARARSYRISKIYLNHCINLYTKYNRYQYVGYDYLIYEYVQKDNVTDWLIGIAKFFCFSWNSFLKQCTHQNTDWRVTVQSNSFKNICT